MKLAISNIAWSAEHDGEMCAFLSKSHCTGLEIAPTRVFPQSPYDRLREAADYSAGLRERYGLTIPSIQSIWYGRSENIFGSAEERKTLADYTKKAVLFAEVTGCGNMVFGCPRNRAIPSPELRPEAIEFFREAGEFAARHGTVLAIEPNPPYYGTNFINTTEEAFAVCREVKSRGVMVNVDLGTCIHYGESVGLIGENIGLVNHIHISEPQLAVIQKRDIHRELRILEGLGYGGWLSVEMKDAGGTGAVKSVIEYIGEVLC